MNLSSTALHLTFRAAAIAALIAASVTGCAANKGSAQYSGPADLDRSPSFASADYGGYSGGADAPSAAPGAAPAPTAPAQERSFGSAGTAMEEGEADGSVAMDDAFEPAPRRDRIAKKKSKPGLGTSYGEHRTSHVRSVSFERGNQHSPDTVLTLRYNDRNGVGELARMRGSGYRAAAVAESGPFRMTLMDGRGQPLQGAVVDGQTYALGEAGDRYTIGIENHSGERYEVLTTVDGLDVLDGAQGNMDKRGYIVEPFTSFVIEGWRTSDASVAAFRFSSLDNSYAGRTGRPRNIGVIGAAFFHERTVDWHELERRDSANPFPG